MYLLCILQNLTTINIKYIIWKHHIIFACVSGVFLMIYIMYLLCLYYERVHFFFLKTEKKLRKFKIRKQFRFSKYFRIFRIFQRISHFFWKIKIFLLWWARDCGQCSGLCPGLCPRLWQLCPWLILLQYFGDLQSLHACTGSIYFKPQPHIVHDLKGKLVCRQIMSLEFILKYIE